MSAGSTRGLQDEKVTLSNIATSVKSSPLSIIYWSKGNDLDQKNVSHSNVSQSNELAVSTMLDKFTSILYGNFIILIVGFIVTFFLLLLIIVIVLWRQRRNRYNDDNDEGKPGPKYSYVLRVHCSLGRTCLR